MNLYLISFDIPYSKIIPKQVFHATLDESWLNWWERTVFNVLNSTWKSNKSSNSENPPVLNMTFLQIFQPTHISTPRTSIMSAFLKIKRSCWSSFANFPVLPHDKLKISSIFDELVSSIRFSQPLIIIQILDKYSWDCTAASSIRSCDGARTDRCLGRNRYRLSGLQAWASIYPP